METTLICYFSVRKNFHLPENDGRLNKALDKVTAPAHIVWGEEDNVNMNIHLMHRVYFSHTNFTHALLD